MLRKKRKIYRKHLLHKGKFKIGRGNNRTKNGKNYKRRYA